MHKRRCFGARRIRLIENAPIRNCRCYDMPVDSAAEAAGNRRNALFGRIKALWRVSSARQAFYRGLGENARIRLVFEVRGVLSGESEIGSVPKSPRFGKRNRIGFRGNPARPKRKRHDSALDCVRTRTGMRKRPISVPFHT